MAQDIEACTCPYCGESIEIAIDASAGEQDYIEDCRVCCRPIVIAVAFDAQGLPQVALRRDDE